MRARNSGSRQRAAMLPGHSLCAVRAAFSLGVFMLTGSGVFAVDDLQHPAPGQRVTREVLEAKTAEIEAAVGTDEETKSKLIELYRSAGSNLEQIQANSAAAEEMMELARAAPAQTRAAQQDIADIAGADPVADLGLGMADPLEAIEQRLQQELADLAAVSAQRADLKQRLTDQQAQPSAISMRMAELRRRQDEMKSGLDAPPAAEEEPTLIQARRWAQETEYAALAAEIKLLDQELQTRPIRTDLLKAQQDRAIAREAVIRGQVQALSELVNRKRQLAADQAKREAERIQRETAGLDPVLVQLAERNAALSDELNASTARLDALDRAQRQAQKQAARIADDHQDARETVETGALGKGLGQLLVKQRESLPNVLDYSRKDTIRRQQIADVGVRRLTYRDELRDIADPDQTVEELEAQVTVEPTPQLRATLRQLVEQRQSLLENALEADEFLLHKLRELDIAERKLVGAIRAYEEFLNEHLLWLRSAGSTHVESLAGIPGEFRQLTSQRTWTDLAQFVWDQGRRSPWLWISLPVAIVLLWKRRSLITTLEASSNHVNRLTTDRFSHTFQALALTLATALPWPLLLAGVGGTLRAAGQSGELPHEVGSTVLRTALHFFMLQVLRGMCLPRGLAVAHFRWPESSVQLLRMELGWLRWVYVPMMLVVLFSVDVNPTETGGTIARLGLLVFYTALSLFFYRVLRPRGGALTYLRGRVEKGMLLRAYPLWFPLLLAAPLALVVDALAGYIYSVEILSDKFLQSVWTIVGLILLYTFALRGLLVVRRQMAYDAAVERRQAAREARQKDPSGHGDEEDTSWQVDEAEVDVAALSDDTRVLLKVALGFVGLVYLYLVWSPIWPALRVFDQVTLWHRTIVVDGNVVQSPITLANLGLAVIYALGTGVLVQRLPAVLEIILIRRFDMSSGTRYAVITLSTYAVIAVGIVLTFGTLGARWSQLQWLVAALGVGIGFGLQEIVANFISGLIILFERPIRIGDTVTVGETDGVVTQIRIRATTIRNWDRKELLVPNKEFITGRLLNWTLSDAVTRIVVPVGVAYETDVERAMALMREVAEEHEHVLDDPAPLLTFEGFGDNSLTLTLRAYLSAIEHRLSTTTELHKAIKRKFEQAGIVIAFPQLDLHWDTREMMRVQVEETPWSGTRDQTG